MKELLLFLAQSLVDQPEEVRIEETENQKTVFFKLRVADGDMGKVIGKQGKNARAIRTIMKAASSKENKKVIIDIE